MPNRDRHNVEAARNLRRRQTAAEDRLWDALRGRWLDGLEFRRQHPVGAYVLDFCCPSLGLVVEVVGTAHDGRAVEDADRTAVLEGAGYRVVRFRNEEVLEDLEDVLTRIRGIAAELWASPLPKRVGRGV